MYHCNSARRITPPTNCSANIMSETRGTPCETMDVFRLNQTRSRVGEPISCLLNGFKLIYVFMFTYTFRRMTIVYTSCVTIIKHWNLNWLQKIKIKIVQVYCRCHRNHVTQEIKPRSSSFHVCSCIV